VRYFFSLEQKKVAIFFAGAEKSSYFLGCSVNGVQALQKKYFHLIGLIH
jgi:hypothetical protein